MDGAVVAVGNVVELILCCDYQNKRIARRNAGWRRNNEMRDGIADRDAATDAHDSIVAGVSGHQGLIASGVERGAEYASAVGQRRVCGEQRRVIARLEMNRARVAW